MKHIVLMRHAKVDIDNSKKIDALSLQKWIADYDIAPIDRHNLPLAKTITLAQNAELVVSSTLPRAIDSAQVLGVEIHEKNSLFDEAAIPNVRLPFFKFKPKTWLVILRSLLFLGLGKKDTSLKASKIQAKKAAQKLILYTQAYDNVLLIGHGGMNWLIGKSLEKEGWKLEDKAEHTNWGVTIFVDK